MNHGELFKVVLRWPCFDVFRSPFSVLSFVSVPVFQFCVLKFYRFEIAHLRRFRACFKWLLMILQRVLVSVAYKAGVTDQEELTLFHEKLLR